MRRPANRALGLLAVALSCARQPITRPVALPEIISELPGSTPTTPERPSAPRPAHRLPDIPGASNDRHGFGSGTIGGAGGRRLLVTDASENGLRQAIEDANRGGHAVIEFSGSKVIQILQPLPRLTAPWVTIDGNGTTLDGSGMTQSAALIDVRTHDVIVRNIRLRNGYDNLRLQGDEVSSVLVDHVSSTGSKDDGISISGGAHDVTVQWSFLAGNTRSIFCKYLGTTRLSIHHTWIQKGWIRNPLFQGAMVADLRNVIVEDWGEWGVRFQDGASGNVVGSLFVLSDAAREAGGKSDSALRLRDSGPVYLDGNIFRGVTADARSSTEPVRVAPVETQSAIAMEPVVRAHAGCLPRDGVDDAYIRLAPGWTIGRAQPLRLDRPR